MSNPQPPTDSQCVHHPPILSCDVSTQLNCHTPILPDNCHQLNVEVNELFHKNLLPFLNVPEIQSLPSPSVHELSTDGECSPSAIAGHPTMQLRRNRDFTDGEAMCQEHLEDLCGTSEDDDMSVHADVDLAEWYLSGKYRKVCVGGDIENIYVGVNQKVWCGWKGAEYVNIPGKKANTWLKHTSSEEREATLKESGKPPGWKRKLVMNPDDACIFCEVKVTKLQKEKLWLTKKMWLHQWQIFNKLSKHKSSDDAKKKVLSAKRAMAKAKAVMLKAHRMKHQQTKNMKRILNIILRTNKNNCGAIDKTEVCQAILDAEKAFDVAFSKMVEDAIAG